MAAPKAPLLGSAGKEGAKKEVSLDEAVFAAEVKPHLVHEAVRAELNAARQGTRAPASVLHPRVGRNRPFRCWWSRSIRCWTRFPVSCRTGGRAVASAGG